MKMKFDIKKVTLPVLAVLTLSVITACSSATGSQPTSVVEQASKSTPSASVQTTNSQAVDTLEAENSMKGESEATKGTSRLVESSLNENYKDKKAVEVAKKAIDEERKLTEKLEKLEKEEKEEKEEKARKEVKNKKKEQSVVNATSKKDNKSVPGKEDKGKESKNDEPKVKKDEPKVSKEAPAKDTVKDNKTPNKHKVNNKSKVKKNDKKKKKDGKVDMSGWSEKEKKAGRKMTAEEKKEDEKLKKQGAKGGLYIGPDWGDPDKNSDDWGEWEEVDE